MKWIIILVFHRNNRFKMFYISRIYTWEPGYGMWLRGQPPGWTAVGLCFDSCQGNTLFSITGSTKRLTFYSMDKEGSLQQGEAARS
jgi:hypothetical protein